MGKVLVLLFLAVLAGGGYFGYQWVAETAAISDLRSDLQSLADGLSSDLRNRDQIAREATAKVAQRGLVMVRDSLALSAEPVTGARVPGAAVGGGLRKTIIALKVRRRALPWSPGVEQVTASAIVTVAPGGGSSGVPEL